MSDHLRVVEDGEPVVEPVETGEPVQVGTIVEPESTVVGRAAAVALWGLAGRIVSIEAVISSGLPGIDIVGLPDAR